LSQPERSVARYRPPFPQPRSKDPHTPHVKPQQQKQRQHRKLPQQDRRPHQQRRKPRQSQGQGQVQDEKQGVEQQIAKPLEHEQEQEQEQEQEHMLTHHPEDPNPFEHLADASATLKSAWEKVTKTISELTLKAQDFIPGISFMRNGDEEDDEYDDEHAEETGKVETKV
jgi:hypothetical protein